MLLISWFQVPIGAEFLWYDKENGWQYYGFKFPDTRHNGQFLGYLFKTKEKLLQVRNPYLADSKRRMRDDDLVEVYSTLRKV